MARRIEYVNESGTGSHTVDRASGEIVGGTAFLAPDEANRGVEIGATWITPRDVARQRRPSVVAPEGLEVQELLAKLRDRPR